MKNREIDYLDRLFASSSDATAEAKVEVPLLEMPDGLSDKLHMIAESVPAFTDSVDQSGDASIEPSLGEPSLGKKANVLSWSNYVTRSKLSGIAASLFVAIVCFQFYQQQQTLKQLEQAQSDLATALHYLGEANRITQAQVRGSINQNINKAGVVPAMSIGIDAVRSRTKKVKSENHTSKKTQT